MTARKFGEARLDRLLAKGLTQKQIAAEFGVHRSGVYQFLRRRRDARAVPDVVASEGAAAALPVVAGSERWTPARDAAIFETDGRYGDLAGLAAAWDLPMQAVQARWHVLRRAR